MINQKEQLSFNQTQNFLSYYLEGIKNEGLIKPLIDFSKECNDLELCETIISLSKNLESGKSFQDSLKEMSILFPIPVELLLIQGFETSCLDFAIEEIIDVLKINNEDDIYTKLSLLVDKKINPDSSNFICEECFEDEFYKLIQRVKTEKAFKVILLQENEEFFIQKFFGVKLITYREPSHSKTFKSFKFKLENALSSNKQLTIHQIDYSVIKNSDEIFSISSNDISFLLQFEET